MTIEDLLSMSPLQAAKPPARYLLHAVHPLTGHTVDSRYLTMKATLSRAADLLADDYCIEIWSSASLENRSRTRAGTRRHDRPRTDDLAAQGSRRSAEGA